MEGPQEASRRLSVAGFDMHFTRSGFETVAHKVQTGLKCSVVAGWLLALALAVAAVSLVIAGKNWSCFQQQKAVRLTFT